LQKHDKLLEKELRERVNTFLGHKVEVGDLVLVKNIVGHKEQLKYYKKLYEVIKIEQSRYYCSPLFSKNRILEVNGNNLKPYAYSELYDLLPEEIKNLMGENLSPEQLRLKQLRIQPKFRLTSLTGNFGGYRDLCSFAAESRHRA
jgi:hypothetical protein